MKTLEDILLEKNVVIAPIYEVAVITATSNVSLENKTIEDHLKQSQRFVVMTMTTRLKKDRRFMQFIKSKGMTDLETVSFLLGRSQMRIVVNAEEYSKLKFEFDNGFKFNNSLEVGSSESAVTQNTANSSVNTQSDNLHSRIREIFDKYKDSDIKRLFAVMQSRSREIHGGMTSSPRSKMRLKSVTDILSIYHIDKSEMEEAALILANLILEDLGVSEFVKVDSIEDVEDFGRAIIFVKNI